MVADPIKIIGAVLWPTAIAACAGAAYLVLTAKSPHAIYESKRENEAHRVTKETPNSQRELESNTPHLTAPNSQSSVPTRTSSATPTDHTVSKGGKEGEHNKEKSTFGLRVVQDPDPLELYLCVGKMIGYVDFMTKNQWDISEDLLRQTGAMLNISKTAARDILSRKGAPPNLIVSYETNLVANGADLVKSTIKAGMDFREVLAKTIDPCIFLAGSAQDYLSRK